MSYEYVCYKGTFWAQPRHTVWHFKFHCTYSITLKSTDVHRTSTECHHVDVLWICVLWGNVLSSTSSYRYDTFIFIVKYKKTSSATLFSFCGTNKEFFLNLGGWVGDPGNNGAGCPKIEFRFRYHACAVEKSGREEPWWWEKRGRRVEGGGGGSQGRH